MTSILKSRALRVRSPSKLTAKVDDGPILLRYGNIRTELCNSKILKDSIEKWCIVFFLLFPSKVLVSFPFLVWRIKLIYIYIDNYFAFVQYIYLFDSLLCLSNSTV